MKVEIPKEADAVQGKFYWSGVKIGQLTMKKELLAELAKYENYHKRETTMDEEKVAFVKGEKNIIRMVKDYLEREYGKKER